MSVFNRKMFKPRNARNALSMSAGIMPVQKFHAGGAVGHIHAGQTRNIRPTSGGSIFAPRPQSTFRSPITGQSYRGTTPSGGGVTSLQPLDIARRYISGGRTVGFGDDDAISPGEYAVLQAGQSSFLTGQAVQDPTDTRLGGAIATLTRPVAQTAAGGGAFVRSLTAQGIQSLLSSPDGAGTDTMGQRVAGMKPGALDQDYLTSLGLNEIDPTAYSAPIGPQPATPSRGVFQGPPTAPYQVDMSNPEDRARIEQERIARAEMDKIGSVVGNEEAELSPTGFLPTTTPSLESATDNALTTSDSSPEPVDQMFMGLGDAPPPEGDGTSTSTSTTKGGAEGTTTDGSDGAPTGKEEIDRVINSGTKEEQQSTLDGFIKEFMDKAPGYEGADSGLILAKIGFAMAAGKSPNAIENIASAMSDGADMLIKDKSKKDEFNRQLKLSAMQYGLGENSKLRTQQRSDDRNLLRLVGEDGQAARISMTDLLANDGKLPKGFQDVDVYLAQEKAALERRKTVNASLKSAREELLISDEQSSKISENYNKFSKRYIDAEVGIEFAEKAMLTLADDGSITGIRGGAKDFGNKLMNAMGMDAPPSFESKAKYQSYVRQAFQKLIPVSLGGVQSANSISNVDVKFLADAYVDASTLQDGSFNLLAADPNILAEKMGFVINDFRRNQKAAALEMRGIEDRLSNRILPGQQKVGGASSLIAQQRQAAGQFGYGSDQGSGLTVNQNLGLVDTGKKNAQGMPIFKLPS